MHAKVFTTQPDLSGQNLERKATSVWWYVESTLCWVDQHFHNSPTRYMYIFFCGTKSHLAILSRRLLKYKLLRFPRKAQRNEYIRFLK